MIELYKEACALRAKAWKRIQAIEAMLRNAHIEHEQANIDVTNAGIKVRAELGTGNYKLKGNLVLVVTPSTVQIQELKSL